MNTQTGKNVLLPLLASGLLLTACSGNDPEIDPHEDLRGEEETTTTPNEGEEVEEEEENSLVEEGDGFEADEETGEVMNPRANTWIDVEVEALDYNEVGNHFTEGQAMEAVDTALEFALLSESVGNAWEWESEDGRPNPESYVVIRDFFSDEYWGEFSELIEQQDLFAFHIAPSNITGSVGYWGNEEEGKPAEPMSYLSHRSYLAGDVAVREDTLEDGSEPAIRVSIPTVVEITGEYEDTGEEGNVRWHIYHRDFFLQPAGDNWLLTGSQFDMEIPADDRRYSD